MNLILIKNDYPYYTAVKEALEAEDVNIAELVATDSFGNIRDMGILLSRLLCIVLGQ